MLEDYQMNFEQPCTCTEKPRRCLLCNGTGIVPTELGKEVLSLIKHNLKYFIDDLEDMLPFYE
jgi:hypothetical protein